jgi:hypothetical protein
MNSLTREEFTQRIGAVRLKPRLVRELRFVPAEIINWEQRDFLTVLTKSKNEGVLLYGDSTIPFELSKRKPGTSGRVEPIICDLCATWQRGLNSAIISFHKSDKSTISYLCCADLDCSLHVRGLTAAGKLARTQLREDLISVRRVERLHMRLERILTELR